MYFAFERQLTAKSESFFTFMLINVHFAMLFILMQGVCHEYSFVAFSTVSTPHTSKKEKKEQILYSNQQSLKDNPLKKWHENSISSMILHMCEIGCNR